MYRNQKPKILIIPTGGTAVSEGIEGLAVTEQKIDLRYFKRYIPELDNIEAEIHVYNSQIKEDSNDIESYHRNEISKIIRENWNEYDGFVIQHGTDTMEMSAAHTHLAMGGFTGKPIIYTGAMKPFDDPQTDAKQNLYSAIKLAAERKIGQVGVWFYDKLLSPTQCIKYSSTHANAFVSPRVQPLAWSDRRPDLGGQTIQDPIFSYSDTVAPYRDDALEPPYAVSGPSKILPLRPVSHFDHLKLAGLIQLPPNLSPKSPVYREASKELPQILWWRSWSAIKYRFRRLPTIMKNTWAFRQGYHFDGFLAQATGSGNLSSNLEGIVKMCTDSHRPFVIVNIVPHGHVDRNAYSVVEGIWKQNPIPAADMTFATAYNMLDFAMTFFNSVPEQLRIPMIQLFFDTPIDDTHRIRYDDIDHEIAYEYIRQFGPLIHLNHRYRDHVGKHHDVDVRLVGHPHIQPVIGKTEFDQMIKDHIALRDAPNAVKFLHDRKNARKNQ